MLNADERAHYLEAFNAGLNAGMPRARAHSYAAIEVSLAIGELKLVPVPSPTNTGAVHTEGLAQ